MCRSIKYLFLISILPLLFSCIDEVSDDQKYGYLTVGVSDELKDIVQMKSGESDERIYRLDIYDSKGNKDASIENHTTVSEETPVRLLMDKYDVVATSGVEGTAFNSPSFSGSGSVRIYPERAASVNIECKMRKVMFTVQFPEDDEFKSMFSLYELAVSNGTVLTFSSDPREDDITYGTFSDVAYFEVPEDKKLTYTLRMTNADGAHYSSTGEITQVAEAEHYHFNFDLGEREDIEGALVLNITLNGEYNVVKDHRIILNFDKLLMPSYTTNAEFVPVPEDGSIPVWPLNNASPKKFTFDAPRGIRNLIISHLDAELLSEGLPQLVDFVDISAGDKAIMNEIGITATTLTSANKSVTAEIDITDFVKHLRVTPDGETYMMSLTVIDEFDRYARCDFEFVIVSDIQAETGSVFRWSNFAIFNGRYFTATPPAGMTFLYKKVSDTEWTKVDPSKVEIDTRTMTYTCRVNGLVPDTDYVFRSTSDKDEQDEKVSAEVPFKTYVLEGDGQIYNLSFDDWRKGDGKKYNDTEYDSDAWYPTLDLSRITWDTANGGTAMLDCFPTTPEETLLAVGGAGKKAAKMESQMTTGVIKKFAAGNIYTGKFKEVSLTPAGAKLDWGIPFTSRPLALRGWFRYEPKPISQTGGDYGSLKGTMDKCHIQVFLTDWSEMFRIDAFTDISKSKYVDFSGDYILAHGEIITDNNTTDDQNNVNGYIPFIIPIEYRSLKNPTYIVISGAASRYGDYFTGGEGSTLYLDELELIYDPDQLTDEEFEKVMNRIR